MNGYGAGRVASESKRFYCVYTESGKVLGEIAGRLRHEALDRRDLPVVGDWVVIQKELSYVTRKQDVRSAIAEKKKWKKLARVASQRAQMKRR